MTTFKESNNNSIIKGNSNMNNLKKLKTCVAILLAITYGLFTPYIYYNDTKKYSLIKLLISNMIVSYVLYKLSNDIKIKQINLSDIISKLLAISTFIGVVVTLAMEKFS